MSPRRPSAPRVRSDDRGSPEVAHVDVLDEPRSRTVPGATTVQASSEVEVPSGPSGPTTTLPATGPDVPSAPSAPPGRTPVGVPARRRVRGSGKPGRGRGGRQEPTRPERRARAGAPLKPPADAHPAPARPAVTVRTLALGLVLLVAFIVVAPTLRAYLTQREQYRKLESEIAVVGGEVGRLERELHRWEDPGYVEARARERLSFVRPGEMAFRVIDPETVVGEGPAAAELQGLTEAVDRAPVPPWYLTLWASVVEAGEPPDDAEAPGGASPASDPAADGTAGG